MKTTPIIALKRSADAKSKLLHKIVVLENLVTSGELDRFPKHVSIASFASWSDIELSVFKVSRAAIYSKNEEYQKLFKRMDDVLKRVISSRLRNGKKANLETDLRKKLEDAESRASSYLNQYSAVMMELTEAKNEIIRLNDKVRRHLANEKKALTLHVLSTSDNKS